MVGPGLLGTPVTVVATAAKPPAASPTPDANRSAESSPRSAAKPAVTTAHHVLSRCPSPRRRSWQCGCHCRGQESRRRVEEPAPPSKKAREIVPVIVMSSAFDDGPARDNGDGAVGLCRLHRGSRWWWWCAGGGGAAGGGGGAAEGADERSTLVPPKTRFLGQREKLETRGARLKEADYPGPSHPPCPGCLKSSSVNITRRFKSSRRHSLFFFGSLCPRACQECGD